MTTTKRGVSYAIEYLWTNQPIRLMTDRLYLLSDCTGKVESLGHSLRREARKPDNTNRVNVSYSPDGAGREVAFYTWNSDWKAPERAAKAPTDAPTLYFFTNPCIHGPSPYYTDLTALKAYLRHARREHPGLDVFHVWSGSHEDPILVEPEAGK